MIFLYDASLVFVYIKSSYDVLFQFVCENGLGLG